MGNIISYLKWRGDLRFTDQAFNEVDNLILAELAYIDFTGIIPGIDDDEYITIEGAYEKFYNLFDPEDDSKIKALSVLRPSFLKDVAITERFKNAKLSNYMDMIDENTHMQFAALHIELDDGSVYIAFRGTDNTIVGWREDFNISFQTGPAQLKAVEYLEATIKTEQMKYRIGGHSKGGNLAIFASMMCDDEMKRCIVEIYDNDGPGLCRELLNLNKYDEIKSKIIRIIPEFSIIGMLFEHGKAHKIVRSSVNGINQHDAITWQVEGNHFIAEKDLSEQCKVYNRIINTWIEDVDMSQRKTFTKDFFDALEGGGAKAIKEVAAGGLDGFEAILVAMGHTEKKTKLVFHKLIKSFVQGIRALSLTELLKKRAVLRGIGIIILGIFFMQTPDFAIQIIGTTFVAVILMLCGYKLIGNISKKIIMKDVKKFKGIIYIMVIILGIFILIKNNILVVSANIALGTFFMINGFTKVKNIITAKKRNCKISILQWMDSVVSLLIGIVALATPNKVMAAYIFTVGTYLVIIGVSEIVIVISKETKTGISDFR